MQYPSSLHFTEIKDGIKVRCIKNSKYSPDIWAMSYLLNKNVVQGRTAKAIHFDVTVPTDILRLYFLPKIFSGFSFLPDVTRRAEEIILRIKKREYITYAHDYKFEDRGTKDKLESLLEKYIFDNQSTCLCEEFKADGGIRQFPANFFDGVIEKSTRIGKKFWVDILTVNKSNQLSVMELKSGSNAPLDLLIQAIDYGIFAHLFKKHIADYPFIKNKDILSNKVAIYLVAEKFHPAITGNKGVAREIRKNPFFNIHLIQIERKGCSIKSSKEILCN